MWATENSIFECVVFSSACGKILPPQFQYDKGMWELSFILGCGDFKLRLTNNKHIFIWLTQENAYNRLVLKPSLSPIVLLSKSILFALSKMDELRIDEATSDLRRPGEAKIYKKVNLKNNFSNRVVRMDWTRWE